MKTTSAWFGAALLACFAAVSTGQTVPNTIRRTEREVRELNRNMTQRLGALEKQIADLTALVRRMSSDMARLRSAASPAAGAKAVAVGAAVRGRQLNIQVARDDWGQAGTKDMERVLLSAAGQLWAHLPSRQLETILVRRSTTGPITLHRRGRGGEIVVKLDWAGGDWDKLADQFARQFCRILTDYHEEESRRNRWFADALGEAAAVYAVKQMAEAWKRTPPSSAWRKHIPALRAHAEQRQKAWPELPAGATLADWYKQNEAALSKGAAGGRIGVVARHLLAALEADPSRWEAVGFLNAAKPDRADRFKDYLSNWHENAPAGHKAFVGSIIDAFGQR